MPRLTSAQHEPLQASIPSAPSAAIDVDTSKLLLNGQSKSVSQACSCYWLGIHTSSQAGCCQLSIVCEGSNLLHWPVLEAGPAQNVFFGQWPPYVGVKAVVAVVTHDKHLRVDE